MKLNQPVCGLDIINSDLEKTMVVELRRRSRVVEDPASTVTLASPEDSVRGTERQGNVLHAMAHELNAGRCTTKEDQNSNREDTTSNQTTEYDFSSDVSWLVATYYVQQIC
jgi:hypothetical protein